MLRGPQPAIVMFVQCFGVLTSVDKLSLQSFAILQTRSCIFAMPEQRSVLNTCCQQHTSDQTHGL